MMHLDTSLNAFPLQKPFSITLLDNQEHVATIGALVAYDYHETVRLLAVAAVMALEEIKVSSSSSSSGIGLPPSPFHSFFLMRICIFFELPYPSTPR